MKKKKFKYNAFISYRHADLDKYVAENLHRLIETYKMPNEVVKKYNITDNNIRRIFRDQEELPLSPSLENPIIKALKESEFLIVICSPRIKESLWCKKEIENFIKFHGRNNILCVLIEGEPASSFPEELLYYEEKVKNNNGKIVTKKVYTEPLAMDVRGINKKEIYKRLKSDIVRFMAPLYKLDYDDIKRRHEERELKKKNKIFKIIALSSIIFAVYSFLLFSKIFISSNKLKYDQSINLASEASNILAKDNRLGAIEKSYQSVTKYNNIKMPITSKGIYELTDSLGLYYYDKNSYYAVSQLDTLGDVKYIKKDKNGEYLLSYDESGEIVLWDLKNESRIRTVSDIKKENYRIENKFTFIGNKHYAYTNKDKEVVIIDLKGKDVTKINSKLSIENIKASSNGKYLEITDNNKIIIYETDNYEEVTSFTVDSDMNIINNQYFDSKEENLIFVTMKKDVDSQFNNLNIITYNIENKSVINTKNLNVNEVVKILVKDDDLIILSRRTVKDYKTSWDMVVTRFNYKNGKLYYHHDFYGSYANDIAMSFSDDGNNTLLVTDSVNANLLDYETGNVKNTYSISSVYIQSLSQLGKYIVFGNAGEVYTISSSETVYSDNIQLVDIYHFNLPSYSQFLYTIKGYVSYSSHTSSGNNNRIIIYNHLKNEDIKETKYEEDSFKYSKKDYNDLKYDSDIEPIIKEYKFKNKNLISTMFYSSDKNLLFVIYNYNTLEIYNNKTKKLLKTIDKLKDKPNSYICKTKNNEYIIKGVNGGYILNKDLDFIAYVPLLCDYKDGKIIIKDWDSYYEVKKYSEKEVINKAKEYLKKLERK